MPRPRKLTKALKAEVCARIADGETVRQIAEAEHMPEARTIYQRLADDPEFSHQYARAREAQLQRWEDEIVEIADDGSNDWLERETESGRKIEVPDHEHISRSKLRVDARKWLMAKRAPKKYGDRLAHVGGDGEGPVQVKHGADEAFRVLAGALDEAVGRKAGGPSEGSGMEGSGPA